MNIEKQTKTIRAFTCILTLCIAIGSSLISIYPAFAKSQEAQLDKKSSAAAQKTQDDTNIDFLKAEARRYYNADSLPLFQAVFPHLDQNTQKAWLNKFYKKDEIAFFSIAIEHFDTESAMVKAFAKKAYRDGEIAFFSVLSEKLSKASLKAYLDKALDDGETGFQAMLYDALHDSEGWEEKMAELEKDRKKEYAAYGITIKGTDYYYKGELVHIFLDYRLPSAVYTLDMNPQGTVNIKITRNADGKIAKASYLTKQELKEWFGMENP